MTYKITGRMSSIIRGRTASVLLHFLILIVVVSFSLSAGLAQTFPEGFSQVQVVSNLRKPTVMAFMPDGGILVAEQEGKLWVIKDEKLPEEPAADLDVDATLERGLIGMVLDPDFTANQYIYLYYTLPDGSHNRISRFTFDGDKIEEGSEQVVLDLDPLSSAANHNGGAMHFGPDGKLFVAIGENAQPPNAQDLDTYHGKMLRINRDGTVPDDNPFSGGSEQKKRVWAYGLRNPYTFDIHPESSKIWVNDVGKSSWEEINDATQGGLNFGWPAMEGKGSENEYENPLFVYPNGEGDEEGCAITGGVFFSPESSAYPEEYRNKYFFQDYCNGWIDMLDIEQLERESFATGLGERTISIDVGNDGNLYYLNRSKGALFKIIYTLEEKPSITQQPTSVSVAEGQPAAFEVSASGDTPLHYQWQKNEEDIDGATEAAYTIDSTKPEDGGDYRVIVSNSAGKDTSEVATLIVEAFNTAPVAEILTPEEEALYQAGDTIHFSGKAEDKEDGELPDSAFTWVVEFHHDEHLHDGPPVTTGKKSGSFVIPSTGETSANVWYRLLLTVEDAEGLDTTVYREILPEKSTMVFTTAPEELEVILDGKAVGTPDSVVGVVGMHRSIDVESPQVKDGVTYEFDHWEHGGAAEQTIVTPDEDITYAAVFKEVKSEDADSTVTGVNTALLHEDSASIYPNPAEDIIFIKESWITQGADFQLVDMSGKSISLKPIDGRSGIVMLRIPYLKKGIYILTVKRGKRIISEKIVIQ